MLEADLFIDTPAEAQVIAPLIFKSPQCLSPSRLRPISYQEFSIIRLLNQAKLPVYLVTCQGCKENAAVKLFPNDNELAQQYFENEVRFLSLNHPNIIKTINYKKNTTISFQKESQRVSFILMEYAPYGDLHDFIIKYKAHLTDKLVRTFFLQLINGLEYLHAKGIGHLDIKLENLLIGKDYELKIADFDLSCYEEDTEIITRGTQFFRAPELKNSTCKNAYSADVYSAGIILFVLKSRGVIPHAEEQFFKGVNLFDLLKNDKKEFWKIHSQIQNNNPSYFPVEFMELFNGMVAVEPEKRLTIAEIKKAKWLEGPVYSREELKEHLRSFVL